MRGGGGEKGWCGKVVLGGVGRGSVPREVVLWCDVESW